MGDYVGPYSPEWYDGSPLVSDVSAGDGQTTSEVPWYAAVASLFTSAGKAVQGVLATQQGAIYNAQGQLVAIGGQPVYNYSPTSTLGGLLGGAGVGGLSLFTLLIIAGIIYLVARK